MKSTTPAPIRAEVTETKLRMIQASDSNLATILHTDGSANTRRCKCAFCKSEIEKGAGRPFNFWRGTRYLCESCFPELVDKTMNNILNLEFELLQNRVAQDADWLDEMQTRESEHPTPLGL